MRKLFKDFLEENLTSESLNEPFDYTFNLDSSKEEFLKEYKKFIHIIKGFFYHENRLVTMINSYDIRIPTEELNQMFKLYEYAKSSGNKVVERVVIEFLYTYYWGMTTIEYKKNKVESEQAKNEFIQLLENNCLKKDFFTTIVDELYIFYKELIEYGIAKDIYIQGEVIERIFNNMDRRQDKYNELIDLFIINNKHLEHIIERDKEKSKHISIYINHIISSLEFVSGYNKTKEMIEILSKEKLLTETMCKDIVNKYVDSINTAGRELMLKQGSFIRNLARINELIQELNFVLKNVNSFTEIQNDKLRECVVKLLGVKRFILSDDDYVNSEMHVFKSELKIPANEIEKSKQMLLNDVHSIYASSRKDFIKTMAEALKMYSNYPLLSIVSKYSIDVNAQTYTVNAEENNNKNNFKVFFDNVGKEYTIAHPNLTNKLTKDYYEELLKYLSKTFVSQQNLIVLTLGEDFRNVINKLKSELNYYCENDYAVVVNNIICIEKCICKSMEKNGKEAKKSGYENINELLEIYKNDNDVVNGLMYLNYTLYEKSGINLRNGAMHGTIINTNMQVPLIVSFAGLIFASWLVNAK